MMKNFFFQWQDAYNERMRRRELGRYYVIRPVAFGLLWRLVVSSTPPIEVLYEANPKDALTLKKLKKLMRRQRKFFSNY